MKSHDQFELRLAPSPAGAAWRAITGAFVIGLGFGLAACNGGSNSAEPVAHTTPSGRSTGTTSTGELTIRVVTASGVPVLGAGVSVNGGFDGRTASTDAGGYAKFTRIPAGPARVHSFAAGFHLADRRIEVVPDRGTEVTLAVVEAAAATPVILGRRAVPSGDGNLLAVEVDIAVLGPNGEAAPTLTATDLLPIDSDCAFRPCGTDVDGGHLPMGGYRVGSQADSFAWIDDRAPRPLSIGLLLDQSEAMSDFDPQGRRFDGINAWLGSIVPPATVGLATYRGLPSTPVLTTYGSFTSDGVQFRDVVAGLEDQGAGTNAIERGVYEMLSYTAAWATDSSEGPPRSVVLVTGGAWDYACHDRQSCLQESQSINERSRTFGIPVTTIGGAERGGEIAAATGGASVIISDPAQYPVAMASLAKIAGQSLGFNRVRWVLHPEGTDPDRTEPVFRRGQVIWTYLSVRVGPDVALFVTIPVRVQ